VTVTSSNLLDMAGLKSLRGEVAARVARARPETALSELAGLWDDLQARAGPVLDRHARPKLLPPSRSVATDRVPLSSRERGPGGRVRGQASE
jgi:hypothetical protein